MKFSQFSWYLEKLESTTSRNLMTEILAKLFKKAGKEEIDKVCYLSLGRLVPKFTGIEFNLAEKMMIRVLAQAYDREEKDVQKKFKEVGDLGDVAEKLRTKAQSSKLSVSEVYNRLMEVAHEAGEGSVERKIDKLARLLVGLDSRSAKYVTRIPLGRLRLGFSDYTILDALSWMISGDKSKRQKIEEAYNVRADIGQIAKMIKKRELRGLGGLRIQLGVPIVPALCQRLPTAEEMVKKVCRPEVEHPRLKKSGGKMAVEPKYDGQRLQIHYARGREVSTYVHPRGVNIKIFTRNLENVTHMFPDIVEALGKEVKAKEVILDGEAIGFNPKTGKFLPFQETIKRKRKYEISKKAKEIPLKFFCFDILFKDGKSLLKEPFSKRRKVLEKILSLKNKTIVLSPQIVTDKPSELRRYHDEQIEKGLEGAVVKKWQAPYGPGRRGYTWVKFKQEEGKKGGGLADTLDCVVMGYYKGRGKRAGFGIGAFLAGVAKDGQFLTISKIGTGLSDEQWQEMKVQSSKFKVQSKPKEYIVDKNLTPDVWCRPEIVVEIEADNITKSPVHTASYALRFPRLVRFRDDKSPAQATTLAETKKLYQLQK